MKKILISVLFICFAFLAKSQTFNYNPSLNQVQNLPSAPAQGFALDARSYLFDSIQYTYRPFVSTAEVLTYLSNHKYRVGNFPIIVNTGGTLSGGLITGGTNAAWWFGNGVADSNLVLMIPPSTSCTGCLINTNNLSDVSNAAAARTNLGLQNMSQQTTAAGGDLSGFWPSPVVAQFNGLPPSYYLNYNNLTNKPTIPAQFNPIAGANIALSGTYPNVTFSVTGLPNTAGVYIKLTSGGNVINLDTANYRKVDTLYGVNDSTLNYTLNGNLYSIQLKGGARGGGGGSGTVTNFSFVNANGILGTVTNPTSIPALTLSLGNITPSTVNGLTLAALTSGFSISGGITPYTLTVDSTATIKGNNSGDVTISGQNYLSLSGQAITANAVDVSGSNITGILKAASFPALTGQVTTSAGSLATTIATNTVTYSNLQQLPGKSLFGNPTSSTATSQATYVGYGMTFNVDTIKVDTATLKAQFAWGGLTSVTATGGNPMFSTTATWSAQTVGLTFALLNASGNTFWGNSSGSSGAPAYMSAATAVSILPLFTSTTQGVVPSTGGLTADYYLNASGTWTIPSGGSGADTNYIVSLGGGLKPIRGSADTFYVKTDSAGNGITAAYSPDSAIYHVLGGTITQNTNFQINSPSYVSFNGAGGDSLKLYQDSAFMIAQKGFYVGKSSIKPYYANAWGALNSTAYGDYNLSIGGGKSSMEFLNDSTYTLPLNNIVFRNAKSTFPKLNSTEYGANAVAAIQVGSANIGLPRPVTTILFAIGDTTNNGNATPLMLEGPGQDYSYFRQTFTADANNALFFGTNPIWNGVSVPMEVLSDTSFFAGDLWNHSMYLFNMQKATYDSTVYKPLMINPTTGKVFTSNYAFPSSGGGGSGTVTSIATTSGILGGTITTSGTLKADTSLLATQYDVGLKFTLPSLTQYSVPIATGTTLTQDNSNFYYNYSTHIFSVGTNGDFTGTNPINIYGQYDAYEPHSAISSVTNALTTPGITASTSRGTGTSPAIDSIGDIIGAHSFWAYTGSSPAWAFMAGMVGTVQGSTLSNLGGQLDFYVKADNGSPASQLTIANNGALTFEHYTTNGGLLYTNGSGVVAQGGAPGHAGMRPYWNGSAVSWTDTAAASGGTTTNAVTFNNSGSGAASGTTFNGASAQTISYNTVGAQPTLQVGTMSTRLGLTPSKGQMFYQTDVLKGLWVYSGNRWLYHADALTTVFSESFESQNVNQFSTGTSGTGAAVSSGYADINSVSGQWSSSTAWISTGSTTTGKAGLFNSSGFNILYMDSVVSEYRARIGQALGTSTDTAKVQIGSYNFGDGWYFLLDPAQNSGQWQCVSTKSGTSTIVNTSVAGDQNYHVFDIVEYGSYTGPVATLYFYIDNTLVGTISSNIPSNTGYISGAEILKRTGTSNFYLYMDYVKMWAFQNFY